MNVIAEKIATEFTFRLSPYPPKVTQNYNIIRPLIIIIDSSYDCKNFINNRFLGAILSDSDLHMHPPAVQRINNAVFNITLNNRTLTAEVYTFPNWLVILVKTMRLDHAGWTGKDIQDLCDIFYFDKVVDYQQTNNLDQQLAIPKMFLEEALAQLPSRLWNLRFCGCMPNQRGHHKMTSVENIDNCGLPCQNILQTTGSVVQYSNTQAVNCLSQWIFTTENYLPQVNDSKIYEFKITIRRNVNLGLQQPPLRMAQNQDVIMLHYK